MSRDSRFAPRCEFCGDELTASQYGETFDCRGCGAYGIVNPPFTCGECGKNQDDCECQECSVCRRVHGLETIHASE